MVDRRVPGGRLSAVVYVCPVPDCNRRRITDGGPSKCEVHGVVMSYTTEPSFPDRREAIREERRRQPSSHTDVPGEEDP